MIMSRVRAVGKPFLSPENLEFDADLEYILYTVQFVPVYKVQH
jgi:hypothetical protein